jgi:serine/threonine protein kinase
VLAQLVVCEGREVGREYVIRMGQELVIGRGRQAEIWLQDDHVSRAHLRLKLEAEGLTLTDLGSSNGSFLRGRVLPANRPILSREEDVLRIGEHVFAITVVGLDVASLRQRERTRNLDEPSLPPDEFQVLGQIGRGASGRVYAVHQKILDRRVAVKVLREDSQLDAVAQARFLREGRVCVQIQSPYVVRVYDVRVAKGRCYLIMEWVNGISLQERLSTPLPLPDALLVGEQIALGLAAAHANGVIHRDVKPGNVLITTSGDAKLGDFGIAKEVRSPESLTATREGLGTLAYVSPEQAFNARNVDARTDIYSLGATIYHAIAGVPPRLPMKGAALLSVVSASVPSLTQTCPACPPEIADFVHGLLAQERRDRPFDAAQVAHGLHELRERYFPECTLGNREAGRWSSSTWPVPQRSGDALRAEL